MLHAELEVLPGRPDFPAVKIGHVEKHACLSVLVEESLELGHKLLVVGFGQLPADANGE